MTSRLGHRGPDATGSYSDDRVSLGFRRLAVIDLATGHQPIVHDGDGGRWVMVLNGEIYNYRELRAELRARGHRFRSRGDVEVAMRLMVTDGVEAVARLNGMFAFALWNASTGSLVLGRDRHGIKPLYLCREDGCLAFASELRAVVAGGWPAVLRAAPDELRHFLAYGFTSPTGTLLEGVQQLAPATLLELGPDGSERCFRYWRPDEIVRSPRDLDDASAELAQALASSVRRQLVADVPVGVFLSGGVDSSVVAALAASNGARPLRTFSVGFEGAGVVSELGAARRVANLLGSDHHELVMRPGEVAADLERLFDDLDTPLADPTAIPTWYMSRLAREGVTVALSGEGADELFGGYQRQRYDVLLDRVGPCVRWVLPRLQRAVLRAPSPRFAARLGMPSGLDRQLDWGRLLRHDEIDRLCPYAAGEDALDVVLQPFRERWSGLASVDPINARLETDRSLFLPGDLLPKVDRMSMAHSLEVRVPYLDDEVVDLVLPWRGSLKIRFGVDKAVLRHCARRLLPRGVARRRKQGFEVPFGQWLRGALREPASDLLRRDRLDRAGLLDGRVVEQMLADHLAGRAERGRELFAVLALTWWWAALGRRGVDGK